MNDEEVLSFRLLGELRVSRGRAVAKLPPSRKTRALLAYLLLTGREHRRERLCGLFWDVTDDPRGALRWSLSKLRALVDEPKVSRVVASRESVCLKPAGAYVDALSLRAELASEQSLATASTERLLHWAGAFGGELMEGLDQPDFHDFQAWLIGEREQTRRLQAGIAATLCERLQDSPERAMPHARVWTRVDPLNLRARVDFLRLCLAANRTSEAEQHLASARRMFEELGSRDLPALDEAYRTLQSERHRSPPLPASPPPREVRASEVGLGPSVGREAELDALQQALRRCHAERKAEVRVLSGEPGIGKTRLLTDLRHIAARADGTVLTGSAFEGETGRPYGPFIDALRGLSGREGEVFGERDDVAPLFVELRRAEERESSRDSLFAAVSDLIAVRAHKASPVLLILDDVQWLDPASAELLHYVARTSRHRPLLVVLAIRSEEASDNVALTRVLRSLRRDHMLAETTLAPLKASAIEQLIAAHDADVDAAQVVEQSGGNPLFALELARVGGSPGGPLPGSVADAVRERLERLGAEPADVLRWGAVLGASFSIERLEALIALDLEPLVTALEELERACLLLRDMASGGEQYRFAHEVVRRVVYADLSGPRRRLMHRRVAAALREREDLGETLVAEIAHHATLGNDHDLAASACAAAGLRCQRLFANAEALTLARRGMHHAAQLSGLDRLKRTIELMEVQFLASRPEESDQAAETLRELGEQALAEGAVSHARLAFHLRSYINWEGGASADAARDTLQAESASRGADEGQRVEAMAEAARCLILLERDLAHADALLTEAEARARPLRIETSVMLDARAVQAIHRGQLEQAAGLLDRAHRLACVEGNRMLEFYAIEHRAGVEIERGNYEKAGEISQQLIAIAERLREGSEAPFARTLSTLARYGCGEPCVDELAQGLQELREIDSKYRLVYVLTSAASIDLQRGEAKRALARASEARPLAQLLERPSEHLLSLLLVARAAAALGDGDLEAQARAEIAARARGPVAASVQKQRELLMAGEERPPGGGPQSEAPEEIWR